jgi:hypothetical protein
MSPEATPEKKALLDAFDTVLKSQAELREAERAAAERRRTPSHLLSLICLLLIAAIGAYLYVERPDWVFPRPAAPESAAVREASLRISMATAAQHIDRFRQRTGRLPMNLAEAGAHGSGLTLLATESGYRLTGRSGDISLVLDSSQPIGTFVGESFEVISRRAR